MPENARKIGYEVFISYRRASGGAEARLIQAALEKRGLRAFLDVTDLEKGYFDEALLRRIAEVPNFLVVLSPNALDRCVDKDDWLRREISCAVVTNRNIIPVLLPKFTFPLELPEEIKTLPRQNGVPYSHEYFEGMVTRIAEMMGTAGLSRLKWPLLIGALCLVLAIGTVIYLRRSPTSAAKQPTPEELTLSQEAQVLRSGRRFDEAVEKNKEIVNIHGAFEKFAESEIEAIQKLQQQETSLMADGKSAETRNDLSGAKVSYQKAAALRGSRELEAIDSLNAVTLKMSGVSDTDIAGTEFSNGVAAYKRSEYGKAKTYFDQALSRSPQDWPQRSQAQDYSRKSNNRSQQQQHLNQAQNYFNAKNFSGAKNEANQVVGTQDGDASLVRQAQDLISRIPAAPANPPTTSPSTERQPIASPEIQSITRDVNTLVQQGQYKVAWSKAASAEQAGGDATGLRQTIRLAEDNRLRELGQRYVSTNKQKRPDLQDLLTAFEQFANNTANRENEAKQYATQVSNDIAALDAAVRPVSPIQPPATSPTPSVNDAAAIQHVLENYAQAIANGDLAAVKAVRQLTQSEEKKIVASLGAMRGKGYTLRNCSHADITGESAKVSCDILLTKSKDVPPGQMTFLLRQIKGQWIIVNSN